MQIILQTLLIKSELTFLQTLYTTFHPPSACHLHQSILNKIPVPFFSYLT